jgi:hypothetical protein
MTHSVIFSPGSTFWKVGSRKIYAVNENDVELHRQGFEENFSSSSPLPKRRKTSLPANGKHYEEVMENVVTELSEVKEQLEEYKKLAFRHKFSLSFLQALEQTFACSICKAVPPRLPLVACQSCATLVGCQRCTDTWYSGHLGLAKQCPKCRAPRGLSNSFILKGFDTFIEQIAEMMKEPNQQSDSSDDENGGQFDDTLPIVLPSDD